MSDLDLLVTRATTAGAARVYKFGDVPPSPAYPYMVLGLDTGTPSGRRTSGHSPSMRWRVTAQLFGRTWEAVKDMADYADAAFKDQPLTEFPAAPFSVREMATPPDRDPDAEGVLYALHTYRF